MIFWPGARAPATPEAAEEIGQTLKRLGRAGRRVRQRHPGRGGRAGRPLLADAAPAARRRGARLLPRGGAAHGLRGDEGRAACATSPRSTALRAFPTDFHLLDAHVPGQRGGTGRSFNWELATRHRGSTPLVLSGGLTPDNVGAAIAAVHPWARGHRPAGPRPRRASRTPTGCRRSSARWRRPTRGRSRAAQPHEPHRAVPSTASALRPLRRPLRAGDADPGARRARARVGCRPRRPRVPAELGRPAARLRRPARPRCTTPRG